MQHNYTSSGLDLTKTPYAMPWIASMAVLNVSFGSYGK